MEKGEDTLLKFMDGLGERLEAQSKGTLAVGTMLTDLVDELGQVVKGIHEKAIGLSVTCKIRLDEMTKAVDERNTGAYEKASQGVYELKGRIEAYLDIADQLASMGRRVGGRPDETKH